MSERGLSASSLEGWGFAHPSEALCTVETLDSCLGCVGVREVPENHLGCGFFFPLSYTWNSVLRVDWQEGCLLLDL